MPTFFGAVAALCVVCLLAPVASAQSDGSAGPVAAGGPPGPTVTRDARGRATLRAVRITAPIYLDGVLDEEVYTRVPAIGGFLQQVPDEGELATEPTEAWIFFDDQNVYIAGRLHDSRPERLVANELRHDHANVFRNDNFAVALDTFNDQRSGVQFQTNPLGALREQIISGGWQNENWNTVWDVRTGRFAQGWTVEMMIPFKSLRYRGAGPQTWGINIRRVQRSKNETSFVTSVPQSYGPGAIAQMGVAATLTGIETPARSLNLELKPYAASAVITDRTARVPFANDLQPNVGVDAKYGLTRGLTADFTVNTDFAQVEEDVQQVNLTRFSLFFPEKRDFFLEGQNIFDFAGETSRVSFTGETPIVPIPFFSRRIGLSGAGQAVPVTAGGRVTGRSGDYDIGLLAIRTDDKPSADAVATTFSAVRVRRNILRRSTVGLIGTGRWPGGAGSGTNMLGGFDADLRFFENVQANGYWTRTSTPGLRGDDASYRGRFNYGGDRFGLELDHLLVGGHFNPQVGFISRSGFALSSASARFSPRLRRSPLVRRLRWLGDFSYVTDSAHDVLEDRTETATFGIEFNSSDDVEMSVERRFERLPLNFTIAPGVTVPAGDYSFATFEARYMIADQRKVTGTVTATRGSFYGGTRTSIAYNGRVGFSPHVAMEPNLTLNWVDLPYGKFTARLLGTRIVYAPTAHLAFSGLTQFNPTAHTVTSSARMRWEYTPGSELFLVYSDGRNTDARGFPTVQNRSIAVKVTRLFRF